MITSTYGNRADLAAAEDQRPGGFRGRGSEGGDRR